MDYSTLTAAKTTDGSIKNWVNDSTVPATTVLTEAEAWVYERLRVREMLTSTSFQFDAGTNSEDLPSDFLDPLHFVPHGRGALPYRSAEEFREQRDEDGDLFSGEPSVWAVIGTTAYVDVNCEDDFAGTLTYFARPPALSANNETNWLTTRYPTLLRRACMAFAFEFKKDDARMAAEIALAEKALSDAGMTNEMYRRGQT